MSTASLSAKPTIAVSPTLAPESSLLVSELFYSIQGESTHAGRPCVFVRLAGCNLRCAWCDASYTWTETGQRMGRSTILDYVAGHPEALVEITGGEPLLQPPIYPLMDDLLARGRTVLLETNGSIAIAQVPVGVARIIDIKCPSSGMHHHFLPQNLADLRPDDELKFVLADHADYDYARQIIDHHGLGTHTLLMSPIPDRLPAADLAGWILADRLPVRLQLQLHKLLWPGMDRGV